MNFTWHEPCDYREEVVFNEDWLVNETSQIFCKRHSLDASFNVDWLTAELKIVYLDWVEDL